MYIPYAQKSSPRMTLFVYTAGDPAGTVSAVRDQVKALAPDLPVFDVRTMQEVFERSGLLALRLASQTMSAMGVIGLSLGMLGLYAVMAFMVSRRTKEIGIRMALGASRGSVLREVLATGLKVVVLGIGIGLAAALAVTRYFSLFLDRVNPRGAAVFVGVPVILLLVALAACWLPARRASRVDPMITLRHE
jgi:ABC-type antimicrobial peptide transport system permease subunit